MVAQAVISALISALVGALALSQTEPAPALDPAPARPAALPGQVLAPAAPTPGAPRLDDPGHSLDGGEPPGLYDMGLRQARSAAEARAGDLDGGWTLVDEEGRPLLRLQFFDPGEGRTIEAAFHDLAGDERGGVDSVARAGDALTLSLHLKSGSVQIVLTRRAADLFEGEMTDAAGRRKVRLKAG